MKHVLRNVKHDRHGFTLAETLIAILILLLMTAIVASGIPLAARAYYRIVDAANAQTVLSTTMVVLREELGLSTDPDVADDKESVTYFNGRTGTRCEILLGAEDTDESIQIQEYKYEYQDGKVEPVYTTADPDSKRPLVSKVDTTERTTNVLRTTYESIEYANGVFTISNLTVWKGDQEAAKLETYKIRTLNVKPTPTT